MATAVMSRLQSPFTGMVDLETRLGEEKLSPAFVKHLEHYYSRAPNADKAKCLELITSIKLGEEVKKSQFRRPRTAMPALGEEYDFPPDVLSPYKTTYKREYITRRDPDVRALRPMTSQAYYNSYDLSGPVGNTTYNMEYAQKQDERSDPVRSGTASGARKNNPHPSQAFMIWRFPSNKNPVPEKSPWSDDVTNEKLNQVHKRLCSSTYQNDYLGVPQGFQSVKSAYNLPADWRENVPYTLDSIQRYSYQGTHPQADLKVPTTRYGSNKKKFIPANGGIPTANQYLNSIKTRTTYDRHYNDNAGPVVRQIRDVGKRLGAETLKKYYERASGEERDMVGRLIEAYQEPQHMAPKPPSRACARPRVPASTSVTNFNKAPKQPSPPNTPMSTTASIGNPAPMEYPTSYPSRPPRLSPLGDLPKPGHDLVRISDWAGPLGPM